jgi:hypothetical protein
LALGQFRSSSVGFPLTKDAYAWFGEREQDCTFGKGGEWMISPRCSINAEYRDNQMCTVAGVCPIDISAVYARSSPNTDR